MSEDNQLERGACYGCMFCTTGRELETASMIEQTWPNVVARAAIVLKRRSSNGVKCLKPEIMIPSYVFLKAPHDFWPGDKTMHMLKLLKSTEGDWRLTGRDAWFAQWLIGQDGEIGMSHARKVGDRIQIVSGPLKDLEGYIISVDKRNKSGRVELTINGRTLRVWLGFELLDENPVLYGNAQEGGIAIKSTAPSDRGEDMA